MGQYTVKDLSHSDVFPITLSFCSFVVFNNLSLQYNSVGFYQLMKVLTTPVVVVLQNVIYGVKLPWHLKVALAPVCIGVAMATVNDFSFNLVSGLTGNAHARIYRSHMSIDSNTGRILVGDWWSAGHCHLSAARQD